MYNWRSAYVLCSIVLDMAISKQKNDNRQDKISEKKPQQKQA